MPKVQKGQISDPVGYKEYETGSYLVSLRAFLQLAELARIARDKAPQLTVPILVFASPKDAVASFAATDRLFHGRGNGGRSFATAAITSSRTTSIAGASRRRSSRF